MSKPSPVETTLFTMLMDLMLVISIFVLAFGWIGYRALTTPTSCSIQITEHTTEMELNTKIQTCQERLK